MSAWGVASDLSLGRCRLYNLYHLTVLYHPRSAACSPGGVQPRGPVTRPATRRAGRSRSRRTARSQAGGAQGAKGVGRRLASPSRLEPRTAQPPLWPVLISAAAGGCAAHRNLARPRSTASSRSASCLAPQPTPLSAGRTCVRARVFTVRARARHAPAERHWALPNMGARSSRTSRPARGHAHVLQR